MFCHFLLPSETFYFTLLTILLSRLSHHQPVAPVLPRALVTVLSHEAALILRSFCLITSKFTVLNSSSQQESSFCSGDMQQAARATSTRFQQFKKGWGVYWRGSRLVLRYLLSQSVYGITYWFKKAWVHLLSRQIAFQQKEENAVSCCSVLWSGQIKRSVHTHALKGITSRLTSGTGFAF